MAQMKSLTDHYPALGEPLWLPGPFVSTIAPPEYFSTKARVVVHQNLGFVFRHKKTRIATCFILWCSQELDVKGKEILLSFYACCALGNLSLLSVRVLNQRTSVRVFGGHRSDSCVFPPHWTADWQNR